MKNLNDNKVINEGKIPEDITSGSNSKSLTKSFKITPSQNEQLVADMEACGCKKFTQYVISKLFGGNTTVVTIEDGHEILARLAECANLLNQLDTSDSAKLIDKFREIEESIIHIFDYIDAIKTNLIDGKGGD